MSGNIKEQLIERERQTLSVYACCSADTRGRAEPISPDTMRTEFQRDRDRITHCKAFRRLMHKTQVFLSPEDDHYRTRLTHTLEVTQIARSIARALRLNEDLCEAIGLGHDLGHTPFGHAGERVLQRCYSSDFTHYKQSLRVVDKLEKLNLTDEVRDGILQHTNGRARTLEGRVVRLADRIAYMNHDIDDAIRAGILHEEDIPLHIRQGLGHSHGERIDCLVQSIIINSMDQPDIRMDASVQKLCDQLHDFLYDAVYTNPTAKGEEGKAEAMLEQLYHYYVKHPDRMLMGYDYAEICRSESPERAACDHIAGMTDRYAINDYKGLFIPTVWSTRANTRD